VIGPSVSYHANICPLFRSRRALRSVLPNLLAFLYVIARTRKLAGVLADLLSAPP
jgi:hypothetical protein